MIEVRVHWGTILHVSDVVRLSGLWTTEMRVVAAPNVWSPVTCAWTHDGEESVCDFPYSDLVLVRRAAA